MRIALDYDGTYTADRVLWKAFVRQALERGHEVTFVTFRPSDPKALDIARDNSDIETSAKRLGINIIYTGGTPKRQAYKADIWIDDNPDTIFIDYAECIEKGIFTIKVPIEEET